eukprot:GHVS01048073.1.p1 GENE.GHVS01048073.1~~GHVS01048073.1.p1  ORF type:complete len:1385 (+),score=102.67 GHVS01048073.1:591-4157(+)
MHSAKQICKDPVGPISDPNLCSLSAPPSPTTLPPSPLEAASSTPFGNSSRLHSPAVSEHTSADPVPISDPPTSAASPMNSPACIAGPHTEGGIQVDLSANSLRASNGSEIGLTRLPELLVSMLSSWMNTCSRPAMTPRPKVSPSLSSRNIVTTVIKKCSTSSSTTSLSSNLSTRSTSQFLSSGTIRRRLSTSIPSTASIQPSPSRPSIGEVSTSRVLAKPLRKQAMESSSESSTISDQWDEIIDEFLFSCSAKADTSFGCLVDTNGYNNQNPGQRSDCCSQTPNTTAMQSRGISTPNSIIASSPAVASSSSVCGSVTSASPQIADCSSSQDYLSSFQDSGSGVPRSPQASQSIPSSRPPCIHCLSSPCSPDQSAPSCTPSPPSPPPSISPSSHPVGFELTGLDPLRASDDCASSPAPHCSGQFVRSSPTHSGHPAHTVYRVQPCTANAALSCTPPDSRSCSHRSAPSTASAKHRTELLSPQAGGPVLAGSQSATHAGGATAKCLQTVCASTYSPLPGSSVPEICLSNTDGSVRNDTSCPPPCSLRSLSSRTCHRGISPRYLQHGSQVSERPRARSLNEPFTHNNPQTPPKVSQVADEVGPSCFSCTYCAASTRSSPSCYPFAAGPSMNCTEHVPAQWLTASRLAGQHCVSASQLHYSWTPRMSAASAPQAAAALPQWVCCQGHSTVDRCTCQFGVSSSTSVCRAASSATTWKQRREYSTPASSQLTPQQPCHPQPTYSAAPPQAFSEVPLTYTRSQPDRRPNLVRCRASGGALSTWSLSSAASGHSSSRNSSVSKRSNLSAPNSTRTVGPVDGFRAARGTAPAVQPGKQWACTVESGGAQKPRGFSVCSVPAPRARCSSPVESPLPAYMWSGHLRTDSCPGRVVRRADVPSSPPQPSQRYHHQPSPRYYCDHPPQSSCLLTERSLMCSSNNRAYGRPRLVCSLCPHANSPPNTYCTDANCRRRACHTHRHHHQSLSVDPRPPHAAPQSGVAGNVCSETSGEGMGSPAMGRTLSGISTQAGRYKHKRSRRMKSSTSFASVPTELKTSPASGNLEDEPQRTLDIRREIRMEEVAATLQMRKLLNTGLSDIGKYHETLFQEAEWLCAQEDEEALMSSDCDCCWSPHPVGVVAPVIDCTQAHVVAVTVGGGWPSNDGRGSNKNDGRGSIKNGQAAGQPEEDCGAVSEGCQNN